MAKHGRDRKRRSGRTGRTKLKNRAWKRFDPNPKISDPIVKRHWDASKSPAVNLRAMGLQATPNQIPSSTSDALDQRRGEAAGSTTSRSVIELFDVPDSDRRKQRQFPLEEDEEEYIARCMGRHGADYAAMFRDIRTNRMQHTEAKLRKLGARYLLLTPEQRRVEVPDRAKPLLAFPVPESSS